jgi:hypothetical protein
MKKRTHVLDEHRGRAVSARPDRRGTITQELVVCPAPAGHLAAQLVAARR